MFIINFDELNFGELFEIEHQGERNGIERAIRLTTTGKIHMCNTISKCKFGVTSKTVGHERQPLVTFDITGTFEVFIEHGADQIL